MFKFLKGIVPGSGAGIKDFNYNIGEPYSSAWGSWTHYRGSSKEVMPKMGTWLLVATVSSVFELLGIQSNLLSFLYSTEVETFDGSIAKATIYIVTEPVMPVSEKIKELGLEGIQNSRTLICDLVN